MSDERDADLRDTHVSSEDQPRSPGAAATDEQTSPDGDVAKSARLAVQMLTQTASPSVVDGVAESLRAGLTSSISLPAFELTRGGARLGPDHYGAARMRELEKWSATVGGRAR